MRMQSETKNFPEVLENVRDPNLIFCFTCASNWLKGQRECYRPITEQQNEAKAMQSQNNPNT